MTAVDIANQRLHNQHLVGAAITTPDAAVQWLGAVQSQDYAGAKWALAQRVRSVTSADIDTLYDEGKILRTHIMRPTWHFVHPADIRWLQALTAPRVRVGNAYYDRKFGVDEAIRKKSQAILVRSLTGGKHLTRTEISNILHEEGITASGLQMAYILMSAELNAVICSGARKGKQHTYALLDERVPYVKPLSREEALAELATRYFTSHGPAQLQDFTWWSGLTTVDAKAAVAGSELSQFEQDGKTYWHGAPAAAKSGSVTAHLLPNYDEYLISYKDRSAYMTTFIAEPSADMFFRHILVVNGKIAGAWRVTAKGKELTMTTTSLITLDGSTRAAIRAAAEQYGRFMQMHVTVHIG